MAHGEISRHHLWRMAAAMAIINRRGGRGAGRGSEMAWRIMAAWRGISNAAYQRQLMAGVKINTRRRRRRKWPVMRRRWRVAVSGE